MQVNDTYADFVATITGPTADLNLGIRTFVDDILAGRGKTGAVGTALPVGMFSRSV